jgi:hypothetical protein
MDNITARIQTRLEELRASRAELVRQVQAHDIAIGELEHVLQEPQTEQPTAAELMRQEAERS